MYKYSLSKYPQICNLSFLAAASFSVMYKVIFESLCPNFPILFVYLDICLLLLFIKDFHQLVLDRLDYQYNQLMALQCIHRSSRLQIAFIKYVFVLSCWWNIFFCWLAIYFSKIFRLYTFYYFCCNLDVVALIYCCVFVALIINDINFKPIKLSVWTKKFDVYAARTNWNLICFL